MANRRIAQGATAVLLHLVTMIHPHRRIAHRWNDGRVRRGAGGAHHRRRRLAMHRRRSAHAHRPGHPSRWTHLDVAVVQGGVDARSA